MVRANRIFGKQRLENSSKRVSGLGKYLTITLVLIAPAFFCSTTLKAECLSLIKGAASIDVMGCSQIQPEKVFDTSKPSLKWIKDLDPAGKKKFYNSYRGLLIKGKVVKSKAIQTGLGGQKGALEGDVKYFFVPPKRATCKDTNKKRIATKLTEICCEGSGDPPCLLNTTFILTDITSLGSTASSAGDSKRQRAKRSKDYTAAEKLYGKRKYKKAIPHYRRAYAEDSLDVRGLYHLSFSYRKLDLCRKALKPLNEIFKMQTNGKIWADEEWTARRAIFLLARCRAMVNDPQGTILILNSYLLEPKKYKKELREARQHKDFGWIQSSKEYQNFLKEAAKRLRKSKY